MSNATVSEATTSASNENVPTKKSGATKLVVLILVISAAVLGAWSLGDEFTLTKLAARETTFRSFQNDYPDS